MFGLNLHTLFICSISSQFIIVLLHVFHLHVLIIRQVGGVISVYIVINDNKAEDSSQPLETG